MAYVFQEYPKNIDGVIVNSKEEEDHARRIRENERLISEKRNEEEKRTEKSCENLEFQTQGQSGGTEGTHDVGKPDEEKPQERFRISYGGQGAIRKITKKEYLEERFNPTQDEIFDWGYKCYLCGKEVSKRKLNDFKRHKETHELAMKIKYGNQ